MGKIEVVLGGKPSKSEPSSDDSPDMFVDAAKDMLAAIKDEDAETLAEILRSLPDLG